MVIFNNYTVIWVVATNAIVLDYTQSLKNLDLGMNGQYKCFSAETLEEIDAKVAELGLTDPDGVVSPH